MPFLLTSLLSIQALNGPHFGSFTGLGCMYSLDSFCCKPFQVLRQLAPDFSYRSLVALGIASIQGIAVATFEKEDAERILFFCSEQGKDLHSSSFNAITPPIWLRPPAPSRKRSGMCQKVHDEKGSGVANGLVTPMVPARQKLKAAAMRPIPHIRHRKMLPFSGMSEAEAHDGHQVKPNLPIVPSTKASNIGVTPVTHRKSVSSSHQAKQIISLNPLPLKKHECGRSPIHVCSEVRKCRVYI